MDEEVPPPRPSKPSQIPSWVMLGFVLGAAFVLALPRRREAPASPPSEAGEPAPAIKYVVAPHLTTIEAVFAEWGKYAVWDNDVTEVALWNADSKEFSDFYEVVRIGDATYFRSIPRLTDRLCFGASRDLLQFQRAIPRQTGREVHSHSDRAWSSAVRLRGRHLRGGRRGM